MRIYFIYLIEDEIAEYFYGRESKFMELFSANDQGELQNIVQKQVQYITRPLPYLDLHKHLSHSVQKKEFYIKGKIYWTESADGREGAQLSIGERSLQLKAWGGLACETLFFEVLRKFDGRFLAMDFENNRYGWLKPLKERKFV
ncbi:sporulation inhibitor of replication protein SirA [Lederbergia citrea]|uniref:Sporulation inhibitor of replication protein SirA n=1 Tax=Lederbergia citrea TaxID=2833581 RepID=A0A942UJD9_9BACI|nr:sporulation inhibitor of replication protein SirA [Lederbergia citrea]MBS4177007.1 sporulation inhibitor of replication protein SirA [Lederbergia citrea]MBS4203580.1 sporulation inhibitor of replication protein SirA [Lederbergia citrea]MBS4221765.1 sporulation inhibitor of replication protein SirA [Lederbergia citrea]